MTTTTTPTIETETALAHPPAIEARAGWYPEAASQAGRRYWDGVRSQNQRYLNTGFFTVMLVIAPLLEAVLSRHAR